LVKAKDFSASQIGDEVVVEIGSGVYEFEIPLN